MGPNPTPSAVFIGEIRTWDQFGTNLRHDRWGRPWADRPATRRERYADRQAAQPAALAVDAKTRVCIYGSPALIRQLSAFEAAGAEITTDESRAVVANLIGAMRLDMGMSGGAVSQVDLHNTLFGPTA